MSPSTTRLHNTPACPMSSSLALVGVLIGERSVKPRSELPLVSFILTVNLHDDSNHLIDLTTTSTLLSLFLPGGLLLYTLLLFSLSLSRRVQKLYTAATGSSSLSRRIYIHVSVHIYLTNREGYQAAAPRSHYRSITDNSRTTSKTSTDKLALTAHPPAPAAWARWPQHHPNGEYVMIDEGMMPYDSRPPTTAPLQQRPAMAPQYFTSPPFSAAPMASMAAPQYQPQMPYGGVTGYDTYSPSPTAMVTPFKQEQYPERPQLRIIAPEPDVSRAFQYRKDSRSSFGGSRSPSVKSDAQLSTTMSIASNPSSVTRTVTSNASVNGGSQIEFNTCVDTLMKTIQSKTEVETMVKGSDPEVVEAKEFQQQLRNSAPPPPQAELQKQPREGKPYRKRYTCDIPGCSKSFFQKTHLEIHRRAHTGDKPYTCKLPGCGQRFSQLGNLKLLKTHERRHTGEKPYHCDQCGKRFAQRGNVRAHLKTHGQIKPFVCKLDGCHKTFTQLGNLKSHQNKFHIDTLKALTARFAALRDYDNVSKEDRELFEYFATLYKNSNKGIKGRGKDRKVGTVARTASPTSPTNTTISSPHHPFHQQHPLPQFLHMPQPLHHPTPFQGLSHPAAYSMGRPNMMVNVTGRDSNGKYEMFEMDEDSVTSSGPASTTGTMYEEDQGRELAFGDRIY
ncbi:hypothetical protein QBC46DRAFT_404734 [Diplogelasinospora grovesii]|uniref:C2H2-type domain-containing protein n=1 Tax=Diplogelasinospora grovesii TaxID=303347 RepID=A0AAN6NE63_9PEZI|nr:hypothetical protein QBC46DRAFT_404734 [Diplogelasinospora grovesii]